MKSLTAFPENGRGKAAVACAAAVLALAYALASPDRQPDVPPLDMNGMVLTIPPSPARAALLRPATLDAPSREPGLAAMPPAPDAVASPPRSMPPAAAPEPLTARAPELPEQAEVLALAPDIHKALDPVVAPDLTGGMLDAFDAIAETSKFGVEARKSALLGLQTDPELDLLNRYWREIGALPEDIADGAAAPPLLLTRLPADLDDSLDVEAKKRSFIALMLPHVLATNQEIAADRERLLALQSRMQDPTEPTTDELDWLLEQFAAYGVDDHDFETLLARVDVIPPALAIAQAAKESGWGTSRFAQTGNALFGQWTWNAGDKGLTPRERPAGRSYRVRAFDSILDATRAYARNLNTTGAYKQFRMLRKRLRAEGQSPTGLELAATLDRYSTIGDRYVKALRRLIRHNDLTKLNNAALAPVLQPPSWSFWETKYTPLPKPVLIAQDF